MFNSLISELAHCSYPELKPFYKYLLDADGKPMEGVYVAGGCIRAAFLCKMAKDIDIFFSDKGKLKEYQSQLLAKGTFSFEYENENAIAFLDRDNDIIVELIRTNYGSVTQVLEKFSFTVCQFAISHDKDHKDFRVTRNRSYFEDLFLRKLVLNNMSKFPSRTYAHMIRYAGYGFKPTQETMMSVLKAVRDTDDELIGGYL